MRVTNSMIAASFKNRLSENYRELAKISGQISSGKKIESLSDDPVALCQAMSLKTTINTQNDYLRSIDYQIGRLGGSDNAMKHVTELLHQTTEIAVKGSNGTYNQSDLNVFANQVDGIISDMVSTANTIPGAGRNTNYFARDASGEVTLDPDAASTWKITASPAGDNLSAALLTETVDPVPVFWGDPNGDLPESDKIFSVLIDLKNKLMAGDSAGIEDTITGLNNSLDNALQLQTTVGAKVNRLEALKDQLEEQNTSLSNFLSTLEDTEIEKAVIELQQRQTAYEATMASGARLLQTSLLDFLK